MHFLASSRLLTRAMQNAIRLDMTDASWTHLHEPVCVFFLSTLATLTSSRRFCIYSRLCSNDRDDLVDDLLGLGSLVGGGRVGEGLKRNLLAYPRFFAVCWRLSESNATTCPLSFCFMRDQIRPTQSNRFRLRMSATRIISVRTTAFFP